MTWISIKSALVSGVIMGILGVSGYVIGVGDVFKLDFHSLINVGVMSFLATTVSLIKSVITTDTGKVAGIQIK